MRVFSQRSLATFKIKVNSRMVERTEGQPDSQRKHMEGGFVRYGCMNQSYIRMVQIPVHISEIRRHEDRLENEMKIQLILFGKSTTCYFCDMNKNLLVVGGGCILSLFFFLFS